MMSERMPARLGTVLAFAALALGPRAEARTLRQRTIVIDDASGGAVPAVQVAPGIATVLMFQGEVQTAELMRSDEALFQKLTLAPRSVIVVPKAAVKRPARLNVQLKDGTPLVFTLAAGGAEVDAQVAVNVNLSEVPGSPGIGRQLAKVRSDLDACKGKSDGAAASRIASLILAQKLNEPQAFETHPMHGGDRQSRLLVEARRMYRMVNHAFVVLTVDNRDPDRSWVLGEPQLRLTGSGADVGIAVTAFEPELPELPPDTEEKVVVAFKIPQQAGKGQRLSITLVEKDGARRFELKDLEL